MPVGTLRLVTSERVGQGHAGEICCCSYAPDGSFVLSGGWDGQLRVWDTTTGQALTSLRAGPKPLSCCAFTDGKHWLSGSMEGMLSIWDAVSHRPMQTFMAHTRPISALRYSPDGEQLATSSWDRQVVLRKIGKEREGKTLSGHRDIVAGCHWTQDGEQLLSWSHDRTLCLWDTASQNLIRTLQGHEDRVTAAALSPDGRWAVSGGRDRGGQGLGPGKRQGGGVGAAGDRDSRLLLDAGRPGVVTVDANGWVVLLERSVPGVADRADHRRPGAVRGFIAGGQPDRPGPRGWPAGFGGPGRVRGQSAGGDRHAGRQNDVHVLHALARPNTDRHDLSLLLSCLPPSC